MKSCQLVFAFALAWLMPECHGAFVTCTSTTISSIRQKALPGTTTALQAAKETSFLDGIVENFKASLKIAQDSNAQGYDIKQTLANVLAGEYDEAAVQAEIDAAVASAPCVMFTWERSPSCVNAVKALESMGIATTDNADQVKLVRLDDPWDEGNPLRAQLGKKLGRSSVPAIFIGGEYVGGFDGGVSEAAPGIQSMAFQGTLRPKLVKAGVKLPTN